MVKLVIVGLQSYIIIFLGCTELIVQGMVCKVFDSINPGLPSNFDHWFCSSVLSYIRFIKNRLVQNLN